MKILIAPNALKGSVSAVEAAERIAQGLRSSGLKAELDLMPIADGGDDTLDVLVASGGRAVPVAVKDPLGRPLTAHYGLLADGRTAVVEMARSSGLKLLKPMERDPLVTTTFGTGELIAAAARAGARRFILGLGGSATNDGGAGCVQALGVKLLDENGRDIPPGGGSLKLCRRIDVAGLLPALKESEILVASDVDNPLLGPKGASAIFGPQKGASPEMVRELDANLAHLYKLVAEQLGLDVRERPGAGAAGGLGAALMAFLGARLRPGIEVVLDYLDVAKRLEGVNLVITGEGQMDRQTLHGKGPMGMAREARKRNIPTLAIAGSVGEGETEMNREGLTAVFSLVPGPMSLEEAMARGGELLVLAAARLGRLLAALGD